MKVKTTMKYHLTPVRMAIIKNKSGCGEKRTPSALLVGMSTGATTTETNTEIPQKTYTRTATWSIPVLDIYPKKMKTGT